MKQRIPTLDEYINESIVSEGMKLMSDEDLASALKSMTPNDKHMLAKIAAGAWMGSWMFSDEDVPDVIDVLKQTPIQQVKKYFPELLEGNAYKIPNEEKAKEVLNACQKQCDPLLIKAGKAAANVGYSDLEAYLDAYITDMQDGVDDPGIPVVNKILDDIEAICLKFAKKYTSSKNVNSLKGTLYSAIVEGGPYFTILDSIGKDIE